MTGHRKALGSSSLRRFASHAGVVILTVLTLAANSNVIADTSSETSPSQTNGFVGFDVYLVLDTSASLGRSGALAEIKRGATTFVQTFDDTRDRLGLITFSTTATLRREADHNFTNDLSQLIEGIEALTDTNIQDGLRRAQKAFKLTQLGTERKSSISTRQVDPLPSTTLRRHHLRIFRD